MLSQVFLGAKDLSRAEGTMRKGALSALIQKQLGTVSQVALADEPQ